MAARLGDVRAHFLNRGGRRVRCLEWPGEGPPVLCLHNQWGAAEIWADLPDALEHRFRVFALDLPGHGETDPADPDDPVADPEAVVEAVVREPAILVGYSAGGMRLAIFALERPDLARRLVLIEPPILAGESARDHERQRLSVLPPAPATLDELVAGYRRILPHARPELLRTYLARTHVFKEGGWRPRTVSEPAPWSSRRAFRERALAALGRPALIICAENSRLCGPEGGRRLQATLPGSELVIIPRAGHLVLLNDPERCYAAIARFSTPERSPTDPSAAPRPLV